MYISEPMSDSYQYIPVTDVR